MALDGTIAQPAKPHDRFPCFDGVRALAAVMVVVYHSVFFNSFFLTRGGAFFGTLNAGVFIFFVTSGCLLYLPFAASHLAERPHVDGRGYAIRRAARVYPAYWLVLAFFTFIVPRANIYGFPGFAQHVSLTLTYVHIKNPFLVGLPPAWSLVVEVSFYAFLPFYAALIGMLARRWRPVAVELGGLAVLFSAGIVAIVALANGLDAPWVAVLPQYIAAFSLGMLLAVLSSGRWSDAVAARLAAHRPADVAVVVDRAPRPRRDPARAAAQPTRRDERGPGDGAECVRDGGRDMRRGAGRARSAGPRHDPPGVAIPGVAVYLGLVSYGIYLWHWFLLRIVADWLDWPLYHGNWLVVLVLTLPIVVFAASVSWFAVERPILRVAHRFAPGTHRRSTPNARDPHALHDA